MSAVGREDPVGMDAEVREKIHLEILKPPGAYTPTTNPPSVPASTRRYIRRRW